MGFIDGKGLKKVVSKIKDYFSTEISKSKLIASNALLVASNAETVWAIDQYEDMLPPNNMINIRGEGSKFKFFDYRNNMSYVPHMNCSYKIQGIGYNLNSIDWPSKFDMHWPNNEIPTFDDNKKYEIYISGGRVVSVDDITPPVEEVTYIIRCEEDVEFSIYNSSSGYYYVDDNKYEYSSGMIYIDLSQGEHTIKFVDNIDEIRSPIISGAYNFIKVDCSKMKSNNLHNVLKNSVDKIIYPEACLGGIYKPYYEFEAPEVNLNCLRHNTLIDPSFKFTTNNLILNETLTITNADGTFLGSRLTNKQINKIIEHSYYDYFSSDCFYGAIYLKTLGTIMDSVFIFDINAENFIFSIRDLKFANLSQDTTKFGNADYDTDFLPQELVLRLNDNVVCNLKINISDSITRVIFINSIDFNNSSFEHINGPDIKIYTYSEIPQDIIDNPINKFEFIQVSNILEVPFQYAPTTWDDVKDYDENGNVIQ